MLDRGPSDLNRRGFLQAGAATATALALPSGAAPAAEDDAKVLPRRKLGNTGVDVTILNMGTWKCSGLDKLVRLAYANGVRYFDAAKSYGSEPGLGRWFQAMPEVRKNIFLVTKDHPRSPGELLKQLDQRLEALKTDYVDLIFIHALGDSEGTDEAVRIAGSKEFKEAAEAIRKSGKAKFVGFSTHHKDRAAIIQAAADAGFVDAIMLQYSPWLDKDAPLNRALDACWKKGIGLISMKQVAGSDTTTLGEVFKRAPMLKEKGLTPYQGLLHAIWTDERISTACVSLRNTDQVRENSAAARNFEPLKTAEIRQLRDAVLAAGKTFCADCDGRCALAAGTGADLFELTRMLTYHEHHGYRAEARRLYAALPESARRWQGADLEAARAACPSRLDFATLLPKADDLLA